jgi:hypothetical protein
MCEAAIFWQYSHASVEGEVYAFALSHAAAVRAAGRAAGIRAGMDRVHESNRSVRSAGTHDVRILATD